MWISFLKEYLKIFKNEEFSFDIFEKGQILSPFSGIAPSKLKDFFQQMYIQSILPTNFQTNRKGGGVESTPGTEKSVFLRGLNVPLTLERKRSRVK